jgi:hypothetical protein
LFTLLQYFKACQNLDVVLAGSRQLLGREPTLWQSFSISGILCTLLAASLPSSLQ